MALSIADVLIVSCRFMLSPEIARILLSVSVLLRFSRVTFQKTVKLFRVIDLQYPACIGLLPCHTSMLNQYPVAVVNLMLNDLRCPAAKGFESGLKFRVLVSHLDFAIALCFPPPVQGEAAFFRLV